MLLSGIASLFNSGKKNPRNVTMIALYSFLIMVMTHYYFNKKKKNTKWKDDLKKRRKSFGADTGKKRKHKTKASKLKKHSSKHSLLTDITPDECLSFLQFRRSYYPEHFTGEAVENEKIWKILEAASWAPTHRTTEAWKFQVYEKKSIGVWLEHTRSFFRNHPEIFPWICYKNFDEFDAEFQVDQNTWKRASHIIVLGVRHVNEKNLQWEEIASVACAVQNMHLMCTAMKLGCYWSSWYKPFVAAPDSARVLDLDPDKGERIIGIFVIGKTEQFGNKRMKRTAVEQKVEWISPPKDPSKPKVNFETEIEGN